MRRNAMRKIWLLAGVLTATVGVNWLFYTGVVDEQILYSWMEQGWRNAIRQSRVTIVRIVLIRLLETASLIFVGRSRLHQQGIRLFLFGIGMEECALLILMTWCRGAFGILCYLLSSFPHMCFYFLEWIAILLYYDRCYAMRRGRFWSAMIALLSFGICTELWIHPVLLRFL